MKQGPNRYRVDVGSPDELVHKPSVAKQGLMEPLEYHGEEILSELFQAEGLEEKGPIAGQISPDSRFLDHPIGDFSCEELPEPLVAAIPLESGAGNHPVGPTAGDFPQNEPPEPLAAATTLDSARGPLDCLEDGDHPVGDFSYDKSPEPVVSPQEMNCLPEPLLQPVPVFPDPHSKVLGNRANQADRLHGLKEIEELPEPMLPAGLKEGEALPKPQVHDCRMEPARRSERLRQKRKLQHEPREERETEQEIVPGIEGDSPRKRKNAHERTSKKSKTICNALRGF